MRFINYSRLFFNDMRVFGWMKLVEKKRFDIMSDKLPPDVIDKEFSLNYFREVLKSSRRAIKLLILDQKKMGGVGNIYACDGLFLAGIDPSRAADSLSKDEERVLWKAIIKVMKKGIRLGGATYSDYKDSKGQGGRYQEHFLVYGREGEKCKKCGKKIEKFKLGGRGTYWCLGCQK